MSARDDSGAAARTNGRRTTAATHSTEGAAESARPAEPATRGPAWIAWAGVAPLAAFLVVHMVTTASALAGRSRFQATFATSGVVKALIVALVAAPMAVHALFVIARAMRARGGSTAPPRDLALERLRAAAGFGTLLFLGWHLVALPMRVAFFGLRSESLFDALAGELSSTTLGIPLRALGYLLGVAATAFHLAASLWLLGADTRDDDAADEGASRASDSPAASASSASSRVGDPRWYAWGAGALGAVVFLLGAHTVVFFATGSRLVPLPYPPADGVLVTSGAPQGASPTPSASSTSVPASAPRASSAAPSASAAAP